MLKSKKGTHTRSFFTSDSRYDLMTVIVVNIGKIHDNTDTKSRLLNVLNTLTDEKLTASVKIQALEKENVAVTEELIKEVESMTSYTAGLIKNIRPRVEPRVWLKVKLNFYN